MPQVPNLPGVPTLASYSSFVGSLLVADTIAFITSLFRTQWGAFKNGIPVIIADNVVDLSFKQEWSISNYPIERGGFESYDKVNSPFEVRVRFSAGGILADRQDLLKSVSTVGVSLDLFDIVTPEAVYTGVNMMHFDYQRAADRGAGMIVVDTWWMEVRQTAVAAFSNTKTPSGAGAVNGGTTPTTAATSSITSLVQGGLR